MDWDKLRIFHAAAEVGSFTHAGEHLHMSQSAVSRQVSALEKDLGVALFHRHARGLVLTEQGEVLFQTAAEVMTKLRTAETLLGNATTKPAGDLRLTCPVGLGTVWITQRIREFMELYPDIRVELVLNDEQLDISMRAADVAVWTHEPEQSDLIRRTLFQARVRAFASAQYVRKYGAPHSLQDLDNGHRIISHGGTVAQHLSAVRWLETAGREGREPRVPAFRANSVIAMKYAIRSGIGIGMIPDYLTEEETDLVPVLDKEHQPAMPIIFVYPEELKTAKKIQVLRDFLVSQVRKWRD
ncbi:MAG TPA: LysR family transcriptional regulator [Hyphomicrobiaceae bacterium]|nr:LysR family transcriptional regulator [Hyphomicrobiaceae bacterium]